MAYVYVKNKDDALDVVQEVAFRSFKNIHTLKNPEFIKTWLIKITINCAVDLIKKNRKVVQLRPEHEEFIATSNKDTPDSLFLEELLENLKEDEKSVILLKFYHEKTFKEMSEILDIPLGTTKSVFYRALEKLRKNFREVGYYE